MKKMIERIMIIKRVFGLILLLISKLVFDWSGGGGGDDEGEMKFWVVLISGEIKFMFSRENLICEKEIGK